MRLFLKSIFLFCVVCSFSQVLIAEESEHEIFKAVRRNDITRVERILSEDKDAVNSIADFFDRKRNLFSIGSEVAYPLSRAGRTPLYYARATGMVQFLLEHGAEVDVRDKTGRTPLHGVHDKEIAQMLLEHGADVNARNKEGRTPLHETYYEEVAQVLLEHGADVNARNKEGRTPLHETYHKEVVVQVLLEHGADVHVKDEKGRTPLHGVHDKEIAQVLLEHGADVYVKDKKGRTPLHDARTAEIAQVLLEHGADVHVKDKKGRTPLHDARTAEIAQVLLEHGADVHVKDEKGRTPLHYVRTSEVAGILLDAGAYINETDRRGRTALDRLNNKMKKGRDAYDVFSSRPIDLLLQNGAREGTKLISLEVDALMLGLFVADQSEGVLSAEYMEQVRKMLNSILHGKSLANILTDLDNRISEKKQYSPIKANSEKRIQRKSAFQALEPGKERVVVRKGFKTEQITKAIKSQAGQGPFSLADIERDNPGISMPTIYGVFRKLRGAGEIHAERVNHSQWVVEQGGVSSVDSDSKASETNLEGNQPKTESEARSEISSTRSGRCSTGFE